MQIRMMLALVAAQWYYRGDDSCTPYIGNTAMQVLKHELNPDPCPSDAVLQTHRIFKNLLAALD